ncbi:MAG: DUF4129 domain-containing protein [Candidatus Heimdallarchaeota archaeon]|nr:DUF4129 domain-containing protein [Candidatus Heimdallarchaeota archaeon]
MEESSKDNKVKSSKFKFDKRFLVIASFLILSIVSFSFASRYLFSTDITNWSIPLGYFEGKEGSMAAKNPENNIATHLSNVSYGTWDWEIRYYGSGSASIIFIGLNQNFYSYNLCTEGYKLQFEIGKSLALLRLDGYGIMTELNSTYFAPEANERYHVKIIRFTNNTFNVFINDVFKLRALDGTYTESNYFQLDWYNIQTLYWVEVKDYIGENDWSDYFSGLPAASSSNIFTKISLFLPYSALLLVLLFYVFRLLFSEGSWTRFLVPLIISLIIGVGYGFLARYIRNNMPDFEPDTPDPVSTTTTNVTGTDTVPTLPTEPTSNITHGNITIPTTNNDFTGIPTRIVSIVLLVIAGVFIFIAVIFIGIDFFRRRDDEFHERILDKDKRWMPAAASTDHRKRVIRAYHKTSYELIDRGAKSERGMTPGEFEKSVEEKFPVTDEKLSTLTNLYEEARFSEHEITSEDSQKAEEYYESISSIIHPIKEERDKEGNNSMEIKKKDKLGDSFDE